MGWSGEQEAAYRPDLWFRILGSAKMFSGGHRALKNYLPGRIDFVSGN